MIKLIEKFREKLRHNLPFLLIASLMLLFLTAYLFNRIVIIIGPGEKGVLFRPFFEGTVVDKVFPEGVKFIFPWNRMYIYNVRIQEVPYNFDALTKNGLRVDLAISIRYHPQRELLGVLHQQVGPDYVNKLVIPEIEAVLRILVGRSAAHEIYMTQTEILQKAVNEGIESVGQRYVGVDDVVLKRIELPPGVEEAIRYKMRQKHLAEAYRFILQREEQEAKRKKIEAGGIKVYNDTVDASLSGPILKWKGIQATLKLAESANTKVVVIGGKDGLPVIGNIPIEYFKNADALDAGNDESLSATTGKTEPSLETDGLNENDLQVRMDKLNELHRQQLDKLLNAPDSTLKKDAAK